MSIATLIYSYLDVVNTLVLIFTVVIVGVVLMILVLQHNSNSDPLVRSRLHMSYPCLSDTVKSTLGSACSATCRMSFSRQH